MEIRIMQPCACGDDDCIGVDYFIFKTKLLQVRFFNDYGARFLYIHIGEKYKRWMWMYD